jgi:hypothetical protein
MRKGRYHQFSTRTVHQYGIEKLQVFKRNIRAGTVEVVEETIKVLNLRP